VSAALSFVEGQDDAPVPVVRNDADAPNIPKMEVNHFTHFVPPYFSSSGGMLHMPGAFPFFSRFNALCTSSSDGGAHEIAGSIGAVLAALTRSDSGQADDSASWRNGPSSG